MTYLKPKFETDGDLIENIKEKPPNILNIKWHIIDKYLIFRF